MVTIEDGPGGTVFDLSLTTGTLAEALQLSLTRAIAATTPSFLGRVRDKIKQWRTTATSPLSSLQSNDPEG
jgi:hypothetical protein